MDLHRLFDAWLADGAEGEPPRDVALHASACEECLRAVAVIESLQAVRVGAAELPPLRLVAGRPRPFRVARVAVGAIAVVLLGASVGIGASGMLATAPAADEPSASTAEGVLAGRPTAEATERSASPSPTPSASDTATPSPSAMPASPDPTAAPIPAAPLPPAPPTAAPLPSPPTDAPPTPAPTTAPTAAPTQTPPAPTASPSPTATPSEPPPPSESPPVSPAP